MLPFPEGPQVCGFPPEAKDRRISQTWEGKSILGVDAGGT